MAGATLLKLTLSDSSDSFYQWDIDKLSRLPPLLKWTFLGRGGRESSSTNFIENINQFYFGEVH